MAKAGPTAGLSREIGRIGHAFHAAGYDDIRTARLNLIIAQHHRLHA